MAVEYQDDNPRLSWLVEPDPGILTLLVDGKPELLFSTPSGLELNSAAEAKAWAQDQDHKHLGR